ncbi:MAG: autotransporter-associated beta strand repeat-containing protein [Planctomycetia bacterium]|nr:autotransporter-associated beta strand repeat-containing protein [Planctomycetia bacterium]
MKSIFTFAVMGFSLLATMGHAATIYDYLTIAGTTQNISDALSGTGDIVIRGDGSIRFSGTSTVSGTTYIQDTSWVILSGGSTSRLTKDIRVAPGAKLQFASDSHHYLLNTSIQLGGTWELATSWNNLDDGSITFTADGATIHGGQRGLPDYAYSVIRMRGNITANGNATIDETDIRFYTGTSPTITVAANKTLSINRGIFNNDGALTKLTKNGDGTLLLTGAISTFIGPVEIADGTIAIDVHDYDHNDGTALGNCDNNITIKNGGTLSLLQNRALGKNYGNITLESGGILNIKGNGSHMIAIGKTLQLEGTAKIQDLPGTKDNQFQLRNGTTAGILVNVPGANADAKITVTNLLLARETEGTLSDTTRTVVFDVEEATGKLSISSIVSGENDVDSIRKTGAGTLVFSGAFDRGKMDGTTTIEAGTLLLSGGGTKLTPTVNILSGATLEFADSAHHQLGGTTLNIGGTWKLNTSWNQYTVALNFTQDGALISGALRSSDSHYATLRLQEGISATGNALIDKTSLRFYSANDGFSNNHEISVADGKALTITETLQKQSGNAADISLTKTGTGTLELVNNPILASGVTVFDGELQVKEGTLLASQTYSGKVSVGESGTLSPGSYTAGKSMADTTGTFTVSQLDNAGKIVFDIDHLEYDALDITGTFNDLDGTYLIHFLSDPEIATKQTYDLLSGVDVGELDWIWEGLNMNTYRAYMTGGSLTVENRAALPEPGTGLLMLLLLAGGAWMRRRKNG